MLCFIFLHPSNSSWNKRKKKRGKAILAWLLCQNHSGPCLAHNTDRASSVFAWDTVLQEGCTVLSTSVSHPPSPFLSLCPCTVMPRSGSKTGTESLSNFPLSCTEGNYSVYCHQSVKHTSTQLEKRKSHNCLPLAVAGYAFTKKKKKRENCSVIPAILTYSK